MICSIWFLPVAPPEIPAGWTTILPVSEPVPLSHLGGVTVTKFVRKLASYTGGGNTVIEPPNVCWTEHVKGSTVSKT